MFALFKSLQLVNQYLVGLLKFCLTPPVATLTNYKTSDNLKLSHSVVRVHSVFRTWIADICA